MQQTTQYFLRTVIGTAVCALAMHAGWAQGLVPDSNAQAGDPAQPVQHSVMTANSFGFFFRGVRSPLDLGSNLNSSGTIPAGFKESASAGMRPIIP